MAAWAANKNNVAHDCSPMKKGAASLPPAFRLKA
jgi:hypothetical protein